MIKIKSHLKYVVFLTIIHTILMGVLGSNDGENKKHKKNDVKFHKKKKYFLVQN